MAKKKQVHIDLSHLPEITNRSFYPLFFDESRYLVLKGGGSSGKCFAKGTKVITFSGKPECVENIKIGDLLMGPDSRARRVLDVTKGYGDLYKISQITGMDYIVNAEHMLCLKRTQVCKKAPGRKERYPSWGDYIEIPVKEYLEQSKRWRDNFHGYKTGVEFPEKKVLIDPYFLGLWLGDGSARRISITTMDKPIIDYIYKYAAGIMQDVTVRREKYGKAASYLIRGSCYPEVVKEEFAKIFATPKLRTTPKQETVKGICKKYNLSSRTYYGWIKKRHFVELIEHYKENPSEPNINVIKRYNNGTAELRERFVKYNLLQNKHIPEEYLYNSRENRLKLLAGIIDTDGSYNQNGNYDIVQKNKKLAKQIQELCHSLGFKCSLNKARKKCCNNGKINNYWRLCISGHMHDIPVLLSHKKAKKYKGSKDLTTTGINVEHVGMGEYYGFYVDGDNKILLEDYTVTHNSVFASQKLIFRTLMDQGGGHKFLVVRKVKQDIRDSAFAQLVRTIRDWGMEQLFYIPTGRSSDLYLRCELNGSEFLFVGLDDVERLKSIEGITDIWVEEASEITPEDFRQLDIRMRAQSKYYRQMILSFNPVSITHWLKAEFFDRKKPDCTTHESTYINNRFLSEVDRQVLEGFKGVDDYYYTVYCLGQWGVTGKTVYDGMKVTERLLQVRDMTPLAVGRLLYKLDYAEKVIADSVKFVSDVNGNLNIYEWPQEGYPYVIGGDTAEGGEDFCTGSVRNNISWNQAAAYRDQTDTDLYAKDMYALGMYYNTALIGIETNFDSHPTKELAFQRYPKQYVRQQLDKIGEDVVEKFGWLTNKVSRPLLVGEHVELAREHIETFNDATLLEEMLTFVRNEKGRPQAQEGSNDDMIVADGIALQIRDQQTFRIVQPPPEKKFLPWALRDEEPAEMEGRRAWKKW